MKTDNVAVREADGVFYAYYIGEDAPLLDTVSATREGAISALYKEWKQFRRVVDGSVEAHEVSHGC
ncbi:hypothetical protein [Natronorubrum bangense]|uniref:Uncharacterized protein n=2 Tax=Natronorubrum bangense TaxID=61858 RepID=L9WK75_9EURY|nr:hypothetical protein [Natronorubrum bangense]ELY49854.1 hypothetical protein C494_07585 [Natronorubrum bangense JCM 10635]QCC55475.1 hypothetical protein DV706_13955 [Natronorubrum bangense]